jgi:uncharacterized protein (DUF1501 family)
VTTEHDDHSDDEMIAPGISRRSFLRALGITTTVAVPVIGSSIGAPGASASNSNSSQRASAALASAAGAKAAAPPASNGNGILVMITLYGGNDGLNTVVPYSDAAYQAGRADLALRDAAVLPIDASFGLHSSLARVKGLFDQKKVAIVHGVGYPEPTRSHFRSMDIWQTARPDTNELTGWLGRWHDATGPDPLRMVNIGSSIPRFMVGTKGSGAALNPGKLTLPGGKQGETIVTELGRGADNASLGRWGQRLAASNADLVRVKNTFAPMLGASQAGGGGSTNLEGGVALGAAVSPLTRDLQEVSVLIRAGAPTRVYGVALGGFDTHAVEREQHARLLGYVDQAIGTFYDEISKDPKGQQVTVVVYSEFGRRVNVNGSNGTDHGTAAPILVIGPSVKGGFYGQPPSLTDLDQGDLKFTTDFRSVYSTVLGAGLGIDANAVLGKAFAPLGFL